MDDDLEAMSRKQRLNEVRGYTSASANSGHDLCWHHPQLWGLLPEPIPIGIVVPPWRQFLRGCVKYRESLDRELPQAAALHREIAQGI